MRLLKEEAPWLDYIVAHDKNGMGVLSEDTPKEYKKMYEAHREKEHKWRESVITCNGRKEYEERKRRESL